MHHALSRNQQSITSQTRWIQHVKQLRTIGCCRDGQQADESSQQVSSASEQDVAKLWLDPAASYTDIFSKCVVIPLTQTKQL